MTRATLIVHTPRGDITTSVMVGPDDDPVRIEIKHDGVEVHSKAEPTVTVERS